MPLADKSNADLARAEILWEADDALRGQIAKLPRDCASRVIAPEKLSGLVELIVDIGFKGERSKARDTLGAVSSTLQAEFAAAEGELGGKFVMPHSVVQSNFILRRQVFPRGSGISVCTARLLAAAERSSE